MKLFFILILLTTTFGTFAQDTTLTILGVVTGGANPSQAKAALQRIQTAFSGINNSGVTLELARGGDPIEIFSLFRGDNNPVDFNMDATNNDVVGLRRDFYHADLVIVFINGGPFRIGNMDVCGLAGTRLPGHWIDTPGVDARFIEGRVAPGRVDNTSFPNLDLFGSEQNFLATIVLDGTCGSLTATSPTHELAHLFGGGHVRNPDSGFVGTDAWLEENSHASFERLAIPMFDFSTGLITMRVLCMFSATATPAETNDISCQGDAFTFATTEHSNFISNIGSVNQDNEQTIQKTALSVANYRTELIIEEDEEDEETGDPGGPFIIPGGGTLICNVLRPVDLRGVLIRKCDPEPDTSYEISWNPGSLCPVFAYEIFSAIPETARYTSEGFTSATSFTGRVRAALGTNARVRVRACNSEEQCTALSDDFVILPNQCDQDTFIFD